MTKQIRYAIRCTPGGMLRDDDSGILITFDDYQAAEAEAQQLTRQAYTNPRISDMQIDFTPVEVDFWDRIIMEKSQ